MGGNKSCSVALCGMRYEHKQRIWGGKPGLSAKRWEIPTNLADTEEAASPEVRERRLTSDLSQVVGYWWQRQIRRKIQVQTQHLDRCWQIVSVATPQQNLVAWSESPRPGWTQRQHERD